MYILYRIVYINVPTRRSVQICVHILYYNIIVIVRFLQSRSYPGGAGQHGVKQFIKKRFKSHLSSKPYTIRIERTAADQQRCLGTCACDLV